ncbi:MAG: 4-alpha-glucanotransferase [Lachnospiraceae bacterium]|nr:4-alpha-glucanotransferase [Lachnospiraceae bacterium]
MKRSSGILLAVSSLPSRYGIGTLGQSSRDFIDFLKGSGQSWWQVLPIGPTSYGDSPYQSFSAFAGNPYFIDPDLLVEDGLLLPDEPLDYNWGNDPENVDYGLIYESRFSLLKKAFARGWERDRREAEEFCRENSSWLPDYALYMALKESFGMRSWIEWPDEKIRRRDPETLAKCREELSEEISFWIYTQFLFRRQWDSLKRYAREKGIGIIGDLPIYVAMDSADVWSGAEFFQLDADYVPKAVAGVPPDGFTAEGQLWGNPLYDWDEMEKDGFGWWIRRISGATPFYDVLRIDHFRGLESYWSVPYGETTAKHGKWVKAPGLSLIRAITGWFPQMSFIAEDLGFLTPEVHQMLKDSGLPGMKVLEFAFDTREPGDYLPHNYPRNSVCYIGTHDNDTAEGWLGSATEEELGNAVRYLGLNESEGYRKGLLRGGMGSVSDLFVMQMQDVLGLGSESRMNTPGQPSGNWTWRLPEGFFQEKRTKDLEEELYSMTYRYGRVPEKAPDKE